MNYQPHELGVTMQTVKAITLSRFFFHTKSVAFYVSLAGKELTTWHRFLISSSGPFTRALSAELPSLPDKSEIWTVTPVGQYYFAVTIYYTKANIPSDTGDIASASAWKHRLLGWIGHDFLNQIKIKPSWLLKRDICMEILSVSISCIWFVSYSINSCSCISHSGYSSQTPACIGYLLFLVIYTPSRLPSLSERVDDSNTVLTPGWRYLSDISIWTNYCLFCKQPFLAV